MLKVKHQVMQAIGMQAHEIESYSAARLSVHLSARDRRDLEMIRRSPERLEALSEKIDRDASEAKLVHAVFEAGLKALNEAAEERAYRELARDSEYRRDSESRRGGRGNSRMPLNAADD